MTPSAHTEHCKNRRFPGEMISHGVWLYYRFTLSYRDVQELLTDRLGSGAIRDDNVAAMYLRAI
jgi:hypothetical protein